MHEETSQLFVQILILLGSSTILITLFHRLGLAPLLAFLLVGLIFGPTGLQVVTDAGNLSAIAELGLSFLLFILGLEFSLPRLYALRHTVFRVGSAQVLLCTLAFALALRWWGLGWEAALLVAGGLSLSSTAIVSRELSRLGQLHTRHGEIAIGVLLFQDLVAVLLLILVPVLAGQGESLGWQALLLPLGQSSLLLVVFYLTARHLLPRLLREVARQKSDELLVLTALVIVLLSASLTSSVGLSMELGAFLAGMMLGDTHFRHQLEADIRPFRDLLLGLFFITIGMLIDLELLREYWFRILVSGLALLLFKTLIISVIARILGEAWRAAIPAGLALSQGSEFLFALLALASRDRLVDQDVASFLIAMTIVSMVLTPIVIRHGQRCVDAVLASFHKPALAELGQHRSLPEQPHSRHVLILGFGRVGQIVARFLRPLALPYLAIETDDVRIAEASAAGEPVFFGDSTRLDILKAAGAHRASLVVISFDDAGAAAKILQQIRELNPAVPVLARTRDDADLDRLMALGATEVIPETHEASLTLVSHILLMLNIPSRDIHNMIDKARRERYRMLHGFYHGERIGFLKKDVPQGEILHAVRLSEQSWACGRKLHELSLPAELVINEIQRGQDVFHPLRTDDFRLHSGDVLILCGELDAVSAGEACLLSG
ncbi:MAG: cation:proton antiporter [Pseudomonadales bacterium]|nr:cation:proton antiporter [Pseudomonadales bacterium]